MSSSSRSSSAGQFCRLGKITFLSSVYVAGHKPRPALRDLAGQCFSDVQQALIKVSGASQRMTFCYLAAGQQGMSAFCELALCKWQETSPIRKQLLRSKAKRAGIGFDRTASTTASLWSRQTRQCFCALINVLVCATRLSITA